MTLAFDGSEDHLASKKLTDLVGEEMPIFRKHLLKSTTTALFKELRSTITKSEGVRYNPKKMKRLWWVADDGSLGEDEEIKSHNNVSDLEATGTADTNVNDDVSAVGTNSNDEVSKETTTNELPRIWNTISKNLRFRSNY